KCLLRRSRRLTKTALLLLSTSSLKKDTYNRSCLLIKLFMNNCPFNGHQYSKTMAKKGNRVQVILECTEHKESGLPGMSRYITTKNKKNTTERLELKKFNPVLRKVTVHKEIK